MDYKNGIWVFGYGSLIWNPGFEFEAKQQAVLTAFKRSFCLWSVHYRGDAKCPGLVLGLDPMAGARCEGVAYFIGPDQAKAVHAYLRERELVSYAYHERMERLDLADGTEVRALCYVVDPTHSQYAGGLALGAQAGVIAKAKGTAGPNVEYLQNTVLHMGELGIRDAEMEALLALVIRCQIAPNAG